MNSFEEILEKIRLIIQNGEKRKVTNKEIAKSLDISVQNLSNYKTEGRIPFEYILNFCAKKRISINWILYHQLLSSLEEETMKYVGVKYAYDINGSCGGGAINYDEDFEIVKFPWYMLEDIKSVCKNYDNLHIIRAIGDSMEPDILDGDKIFVDTTQTELNNKDIFVVSTNDGIFIKRIIITDDDKIVVKSSNPDYNDIIVDTEIKIIGKVIGKVL